MDWKALRDTLPRDGDLPARTARVLALTSVLEGGLYDGMPNAFSEEVNAAGEYIPLRKRRPAVKTRLCRTVVDDSVSLLFSEGHFPAVHADDGRTRDAIAALVAERRLGDVMIDAATRGSVGSVAILLRVLRAKPFFTVLPTAYLAPEWDPEDPETLLRVTERYKVRGSDLRDRGYAVSDDDLGCKFWFQRVWCGRAETWFMPWKTGDEKAVPVTDPGRTVEHGLGFCPLVWVRNLPGGDDVDGGCTFESGIDVEIEADYTISQAGRALRYASDPRLVIRDAASGMPGQPGSGDRPVTGGAANVITLTDPQGDAKFLEINGTAASASDAYTDRLRRTLLEACHGNRTDPDKLSGAQSGRAMEMMNQGLVWLADRLRISYGQTGLLSLLRMVVAASAVVQRGEGGLLIDGVRYRDLDAKGLALQWPRWYAATAEDKSAEATTLAALVAAGIVSRETATRIIAATYDIPDVQAERALIAAEQAAEDARAKALAAQVRVDETAPA